MVAFFNQKCLVSKNFSHFSLCFSQKIGASCKRKQCASRQKPWPVLQVVPDTLIADLSARGVMTVIHGHTHQPG